MDFKNDWRNRGQLDYLNNIKIKKNKFVSNNKHHDHVHCDFCWDEISLYKNAKKNGYCTLDERKWICEDCYNDLKSIFNWKIIEE